MESREDASISRQATAVFRQFECFWPSTSKQQGTLDGAVHDAFERYCLWAGNLGAFNAPHDSRSLDYRLRNAPSVGRRIGELLSELSDLLRSRAIYADGDQPAQYGVTANPVPAQDFDSDDEDIIRGLAGFTRSREAKDSLLASGISDVVTRLFKMSAVLAKSTVTDRYAKAEASSKIKLDPSFDIAHVREKFTHIRGEVKGCHAKEWLIERLGAAITKRRQYLSYCQSHREKLAKHTHAMTTANRSANEAPILSQLGSTRKTQCTGPSAIHTTASSLGLVNLDVVDDGFDDNRSYSTMATSIGGSDEHLLRVPPLSEVATIGEHFECPYCRTIKKFNGQVSWRKHVFADIRPYVCTFRNCGMLMFDSKRAWAEHELQYHRRLWICQVCKRNDFADMDILHQHLEHAHGTLTDGMDEPLRMKTDSRPAEIIFATECLLCDWDKALRPRNPHVAPNARIAVTLRQFTNHVAKHLEQLALFALPRGFRDGSEADSAEVARGQSQRSSQDLMDDISIHSTLNKTSANDNDADGYEFADVQRPTMNEDSEIPLTTEHFAVWQSNSIQQNDKDKAVSWLANTEEANVLEQPIKSDHIQHIHPANLLEGSPEKPELAFSVHVPDLPGVSGDVFQGVPPSIFLRSSTKNPSRKEDTMSSAAHSDDEEESNNGTCPLPTCGRQVKDLKAHMLLHQNERPEKCPFVDCPYHIKGFARKYDKNRHTLTHYKGTLVCGFCPGSGSAAEKTFKRADVFKRHLTSVHGVEQTAPNARRKPRRPFGVRDVSGMCSTCTIIFARAEEFYEHLDECVLRVVQQIDPAETINEKLLSSMADDLSTLETLGKHELLLSNDASIPVLFDHKDEDEEDDEEGKGDDYEDAKDGERAAREADRRLERGEDMGSPPTPTLIVKRKYDGSQHHTFGDRGLTIWPETAAPLPTSRAMQDLSGAGPPSQDLGSTPSNAPTSSLPTYESESDNTIVNIYLNGLAEFHKQNGVHLNRFPSIDKRPIDLYRVKLLVNNKGGFDSVCKYKRWAEIGRDLGYSGKNMSSLSTSLKNCYQKWLLPFEEYLTVAVSEAKPLKPMGDPYTPSSALSFVEKAA